MTDSLRSYTARVPCVDEAAARALDAYARRFSLAVRWAFAQQDKAILAGRAPTKAQRKQAVLERFGFTSRQANAVLVEADGKRAAQLELDDALDQSLTEQIVKKTRLLAAAQKTLEAHREGKTLRLSAKALRDLKRRIFPLTTVLARLNAKRNRLRARTDLGLTRMTFGTKKLLRRRAGLTSGQDVAAWRKQWDDVRNSQFLVLGSKDEAGGCQGCVATMDATGAVTLRVRLPEVEGGGYVVLSGIRFQYGAERLAYALAQQAVRAEAVTKVKARVQLRKDAGDTEAKFSQKDIKAGAAITWRFMRQPDGSWRVAFTSAVECAVRVTSRQAGAIGVDFNAGFITVTESDRFGSLMAGSRNVMLPTTGHSAGQRESAMGEAVKGLIGRCLARGKALVLEDLDFRRKKKSEVLGTSSRRKVSALAYGQFRRLCAARWSCRWRTQRSSGRFQRKSSEATWDCGGRSCTREFERRLHRTFAAGVGPSWRYGSRGDAALVSARRKSRVRIPGSSTPRACRAPDPGAPLVRVTVPGPWSVRAHPRDEQV